MSGASYVSSVYMCAVYIKHGKTELQVPAGVALIIDAWCPVGRQQQGQQSVRLWPCSHIFLSF